MTTSIFASCASGTANTKHNHYGKKEWCKRENMDVDEKNVIKLKLVGREKIILPALHTKLDLMKQFAKALDKNESCFAFTRCSASTS